MSERRSVSCIVILAAMTIGLTSCSVRPQSDEPEGRPSIQEHQEDKIDETQADAAMDEAESAVLAMLPVDGEHELVTRRWGPAVSECSPTTIQKSRFIETRPRIDSTPDDLVRSIAETWKETTQLTVVERPSSGGAARAILDDPADGSGVVVSQWDPPLIQITIYSPCYPG